MDETAFMAEAEAVAGRLPGLSMLEAGLLVAMREGIAADTRSFSNLFGVAHALVLRVVNDLSDDRRLVTETGRDARTQRTRLALTDAGRRLFEAQPEPLAA
ncbi:hypothetical protein [Methylopila sp. M107]|uniref:hypothetical protein n=1 Tax=Methylopila sp. M107 TaxID=1101190 RepID=UPI0003677B9E|nr:hypothetical protein [Methylopila sp. M107]